MKISPHEATHTPAPPMTSAYKLGRKWGWLRTYVSLPHNTPVEVFDAVQLILGINCEGHTIQRLLTHTTHKAVRVEHLPKGTDHLKGTSVQRHHLTSLNTARTVSLYAETKLCTGR